MKKVIMVICLLCLVGCGNKEKLNQNDISAYTEKVLLEREADQTSINEETYEDSINYPEKFNKNDETEVFNVISEDINDKQEEIDCTAIDECISQIKIIQNIFASVIDDVSYLEKKLGYQIKYKFRSHQFGDFDECMVFNNNLIDKLGKKISSSICDEAGKIEILASDTEVMDEEMVN